MPCPLPSSESTALVTGASAGIGVELARDLSRRGYHVTLVARRADRLEQLADELGNADAVACDLRDPQAREALLAGLERRVDILVNNAGLGASGRFWKVERERLLAMTDTNIEALVDLSRRCIEPMIARGEGAILNVASTAAFQPIPNDAVYAATKAFVLSFSDALSVELRGSGVTCTSLCPGPTSTEFAEVAGIAGVFDKLPGPLRAEAAPVASAGIDAMIRGKRSSVPGLINRVGAVAGSKSPRPLVLRTMGLMWPGGR